jgi:16S rRNA (guanine527-N7)-methyltransferase
MTPEAALDRGLAELGLSLPESAHHKLIAYLALLAKWNQTYNLTAIRDPITMVSHHLLDSLSVLPHLGGGRLADVGSGAGLPGIPIAIAEPERLVVLNDASQKRAAFLRQAVIELPLPNAQVHAGRAEAWQPLERFAIVICRAYAEIAELIATCKHLVAPGGVLAAMKGIFPARELARIPASASCREVIRLEVPLLGEERHLVLCRGA